MAQLIDGKSIAQEIRNEIRAEVADWVHTGHRPPQLTVVLVGDDPASASYVRGKQRAAEEVGIESTTLTPDPSISEHELVDLVEKLNRDPDVDGILVQLPLPPHINPTRIIATIDPDKDVDGFHPENAGRLMTGQKGFIPATPFGIMELLRRSNVSIESKECVVVGRSNIVGKPTALLLGGPTGNGTVTLCHRKTVNLASHTRRADILVVAVGKVNLITADMVKEGATVIDVGINRMPDPTRKRGYRLVGDVDFKNVEPKVARITPVPGGVGPMTIAMLLRNTLTAATRHAFA